MDLPGERERGGGIKSTRSFIGEGGSGKVPFPAAGEGGVGKEKAPRIT